MTFFEQLEANLVAASERWSAVGSTERTRPPWGRRLPIAVVAGLALAGTALAATHPWSPSLGDRRLGPPPAVSRLAPPASQLAILSVLRRTQTDRDRGAATANALRYLGRGGSGVRTAYIRLLGLSAPSQGIVLIPMERYSPGPGLVKRDALCVFYAEPNGDGGGKHCFDTSDVQNGRARASLGVHQYGLVPDGVAKVTALFAEGPLVETAVHDNFYDLIAPRARGDAETIAADPAVVSWQDKNGRPVGPPPAG
jgi:hypothetical protein